MTLKERIEAMRLPGHNGPQRPKTSPLQNKVLINAYAKKIEEKLQ